MQPRLLALVTGMTRRVRLFREFGLEFWMEGGGIVTPRASSLSAFAAAGLVPERRRPHIPCIPHSIGDRDPAANGRFPATLKGLTMNARFLRDEASRFRGMADDTDREATRVRLLAMAADYDARAGIDDEPTGADPEDANSEPAGAIPEAMPQPAPARKIVARAKETVVIERRPAGRPPRE